MDGQHHVMRADGVMLAGSIDSGYASGLLTTPAFSLCRPLHPSDYARYVENQRLAAIMPLACCMLQADDVTVATPSS